MDGTFSFTITACFLCFSRSVPVLWAHRPCQHGRYFSRQHSGPVAHEFWRVNKQTSLSLWGFRGMCAPLVRCSRSFIQRLLTGDGICPALPRGHTASAGLESRPAAPLSDPHAADEHWASAVRLAHCPGYTQPQVTQLLIVYTKLLYLKTKIKNK